MTREDPTTPTSDSTGEPVRLETLLRAVVHQVGVPDWENEVRRVVRFCATSEAAIPTAWDFAAPERGGHWGSDPTRRRQVGLPDGLATAHMSVPIPSPATSSSKIDTRSIGTA